jgi:hypothetical protein
VAHQFLLNVRKRGPWTVIVLFLHGNGKMIAKSFEMSEDGSANLIVCSRPRPEVGWRSARNARHPRQRRCAKFFVYLEEQLCPAPQVIEQLIELTVQRVVLGNLSVGLLYILDDIDDLAQHIVDRSDGIMR